ncbi:hypothetical protein J3F83DRAFT_759835 [Trichoderma novae-zelandiae]
MSIPLLDASLQQAGSDSRRTYIMDLVQSFKDFGFARLTNHGIPATRVAQILALAAELFHLEPERKLEFVNVADGNPQRGYSAIGVEKTASLHANLVGRNVDEKLTDAREHFDCGSPLDHQFKNRWPKDSDRFRTELELFYFEMERATAGILSCLEEGLGSSPGTFNRLISHENNASELQFSPGPQKFIAIEPENEAELIALEDKIKYDKSVEVPRRYSIAFLCKADRQAPVGTIPSVCASEYYRLRLSTAY